MESKNPKKSKTLAKHPRLRTALVVLALVIWVVSVIFVCEYLVTFGFYYLLGYERLTTPVWTTVVNALIYGLALLLIIWVPIKVFKRLPTSREELGLSHLPTWTDLGLAVVGFIVYFILAILLATLFSLFPFYDASEAQDVGYNFLGSGLDRVVAFLALVIIAPIVEEIIFRGWLYGKLRAKIPGKLSLVLSALLVSVVFGILHGQWNVGVNVFAMSLALCALREITGTIYSGIILHVIKNAVAFVIIYIMI